MSHNRHRLLSRQVRKHLPGTPAPEVEDLLGAVNESYEHFDRDRQLLERAMELSSNELLAKNQELKDKNEALDSFVYRVSHDLRTPANNIHSMVRMLRDIMGTAPLSPLQERILGNMEKSCEVLDERLKNLLDMARVEKRQDETKVEVHIPEVVEEVRHTLREEFQRNEAVLNLHLEGFDTLVIGKENALSIFSNLISNGIKYRAMERNPEITITSSMDDGVPTLKFQDNGLGINMEKYGPRLFGMFNRLHNHVVGSGVGLYIIKKIVESNGGSIRVESEEGKGTVFIITFPNESVQNKAWLGASRG
jgi:signal transduction histidine kinase